MEIVNVKIDPIHLALRGKGTLSHPSGPLITAYPSTQKKCKQRWQQQHPLRSTPHYSHSIAVDQIS